MSNAVKLNNVQIESVVSLIQKVQSKPEVAKTNWKASVQWKGAFQSEAKVRDFAPVKSDEPTSLGGGDSAANPVEQLLGALGNCLAVGYAANATAAGIAIKDLRIELDGDLNLHTFLGLREGGNAGYEKIRAKVHLESDAPADKIAELHKKVIGTSPVGHTLSRPVPVSIELA
ncbi:MAG: OsmC family protein [Spirochaetes bacterium]|nr:OsmC family protein [Spirochaetota bacterium]